MKEKKYKKKLKLRYASWLLMASLQLNGCREAESASALFRATPSKPPSKNAIVPESNETRLEIIERAGAWTGDERGERTVLQGPLQKKETKRFTFNQDVRCRFMEPAEIDEPNGGTPKFKCEANGHDLKVKYRQPGEFNPGIWGEVLSTRLFWAMGFPADTVYPVQVICENCPSKPWRYYDAFFTVKNLEEFKAKLESEGKTLNVDKQKRLDNAKKQVAEFENKRQTLILPDAVIEFKYDARVVERFDNEGWSWKEFDRLSLAVEDHQRLKTERDALALLSAFIQHADNKAEQQRLVCLDKEDVERPQGVCSKPIMMVQDLGFTFGSGWIAEGTDPRNPSRIIGKGTTADLEAFSAAPLWADAAACVTQINYFMPTGMEANKRVSEEGRAFLAEKLAQFISRDENVLELFQAARIDRLTIKDRESGSSRYHTAEEWVKAFKARAQEIIEHRCPVL